MPGAGSPSSGPWKLAALTATFAGQLVKGVGHVEPGASSIGASSHSCRFPSQRPLPGADPWQQLAALECREKLNDKEDRCRLPTSPLPQVRSHHWC